MRWRGSGGLFGGIAPGNEALVAEAMPPGGSGGTGAWTYRAVAVFHVEH